VNSVVSVGKKRKDGMPVGKPFPKGNSGNPDGRPVGTLSLSTRVRAILEGETELPSAIKTTIINAVGEDKCALDAILIVNPVQTFKLIRIGRSCSWKWLREREGVQELVLPGMQ